MDSSSKDDDNDGDNENEKVMVYSAATPQPDHRTIEHDDNLCNHHLMLVTLSSRLQVLIVESQLQIKMIIAATIMKQQMDLDESEQVAIRIVVLGRTFYYGAGSNKNAFRRVQRVSRHAALTTK
jgi:hypothetical protein